MLRNLLRFVLALVLAVALGMTVFAVDTARAQDEDAVGASPSQEARERINQIRANEFFYQSYGRQDPFKELVTGDFEQKAGAAELVDLNSAKLVGVMWGEADTFALVEDGAGFGYILRVGDRVRNGRVVSIRKNTLTASITLYGITSSVVLKLDKAEGK